MEDLGEWINRYINKQTSERIKLTNAYILELKKK